MQFSSNLPATWKQISAHASGTAKVTMNVSEEANAAFMQELKRTDRKRYDNLVKSIRSDAIRAQAAS